MSFAKRFFTAIFFSFFLVGIATAQNIRDGYFRYNPVMESRGAKDLVPECLNDTLCKEAVKAAAAYFGVDPQTIDALAVINRLSPSVNGEVWHLNIAAPSGLNFCNVRAIATSVAPASGDRATHFIINGSRDEIRIYTWTPRRGHGGGRSWYDGVIYYELVDRSDFNALASSNRCAIPYSFDNGKRRECRGSQGGKGLPGCGDFWVTR